MAPTEKFLFSVPDVTDFFWVIYYSLIVFLIFNLIFDNNSFIIL